ncbi:hypothetical protein [Mucilaginibacter sp. L3T2-6]|uniref:hypothetical protein n=1 Tax=Mucilaginibacter sp. L3T2-6 TaxID=3062491 RepID=UPI00267616DE|nr:hypothetical protein [Mucilaginibacter sp. L3T2-6]MDO3641777.1 hypothetical protein [Mucilaginibacter sp. L3T2-6]MDV6214271.1 hypothetical protein [Mucilaginibacter sp. L3T2-6]
MKAIRNNAYDINTWHQVSSKIKNADYDRQNENRDFVDRVKAAQASNTDTKVAASKK